MSREETHKCGDLLGVQRDELRLIEWQGEKDGRRAPGFPQLVAGTGPIVLPSPGVDHLVPCTFYAIQGEQGEDMVEERIAWWQGVHLSTHLSMAQHSPEVIHSRHHTAYSSIRLAQELAGRAI